MSLLSLILYVPLQILFIPLAVLGSIYVACRQIGVSKKLGISQTAIEVINGRWTMHIFGIRTDPACEKLAKVLSNTSVNGLWLALVPLWLKFKISGELFLYPRIPERGDEGLRDLMISRTLYFDRVIERVIDDVEQFVFMGAGYDTRAYGGLSTKGVAIFEMDQVAVQQHKIQGLAAAGIAFEHVHFIAVDFSRDDAFEKLANAGFDRTKKTLFLWEGVTLYLSEADVRKTMQDVCNNSPAGSVLLADIYADSFVKNIGSRSGVREILEYTNEGLEFSLSLATDYQNTLSDFVESESMSVGEVFFMGSNSDNGPFMAVVEMQR